MELHFHAPHYTNRWRKGTSRTPYWDWRPDLLRDFRSSDPLSFKFLALEHLTVTSFGPLESPGLATDGDGYRLYIGLL